jgi:hypothetical protein
MKPSLWLLQLILVQYNDDASDERKVRMMIMVEPPILKNITSLCQSGYISKHAV